MPIYKNWRLLCSDIWSGILLSTPNKKHDIYRAFLRFRAYILRFWYIAHPYNGNNGNLSIFH